MLAEIKKTESISGEIEVPGDKSISHRALIFGAVAKGKTKVVNFLNANDCMSTMEALKSAGVEIKAEGSSVFIEGRAGEFDEPEDIIDCGNSGTTIRLLSGIFASRPFYTVMTGDRSLRNRPMDRIIEPLRMMGAKISARGGSRYPPLTIEGKNLRGIEYSMPVASAQVKSCIMLAALFSEGKTAVAEPFPSRDHTERMLKYFGGRFEKEGGRIIIEGRQELCAREVFVPGDFSSASYFMAASLMSGQSSVRIKNVGLNPTRAGFIDVLRRMGAGVHISNYRELSGEPLGDIEISAAVLKGIDITPREVPVIIDEIPLVAAVASVAEGRTSISGAAELRVKESDRLKAISTELGKMGAKIEAFQDGLHIEGVKSLKGARTDSWNDHRIAMALAVSAMRAEGTTVIENFECVKISFPSFPELLAQTGADINIRL